MKIRKYGPPQTQYGPPRFKNPPSDLLQKYGPPRFSITNQQKPQPFSKENNRPQPNYFYKNISQKLLSSSHYFSLSISYLLLIPTPPSISFSFFYSYTLTPDPFPKFLFIISLISFSKH